MKNLIVSTKLQNTYNWQQNVIIFMPNKTLNALSQNQCVPFLKMSLKLPFLTQRYLFYLVSQSHLKQIDYLIDCVVLVSLVLVDLLTSFCVPCSLCLLRLPFALLVSSFGYRWPVLCNKTNFYKLLQRLFSKIPSKIPFEKNSPPYLPLCQPLSCCLFSYLFLISLTEITISRWFYSILSYWPF